MDQHQLRALESRCIQEEPAQCRAACPLHVDVRTFVAEIRCGHWQEAEKTLRKTMPVAGILGRICDAPCQPRCKRAEVDDPVRIGELERACVSRSLAKEKVVVLPARNRSVAVAGAGLAGLTAAWDLLRKGYQVAVYAPDEIAEGLFRRLDHPHISLTAIEEEIAALKNIGAVIQSSAPMDDDSFLERILSEHDAAVLDLAVLLVPPWGLATSPDGKIRIEPVTRALSRKGVFASEETSSFVGQAASGRWAATSVDRFLQGVTLTAGREKEGPIATRLYTSLAGVNQISAVLPADPAAGYSNDEACREAERCLLCECKECVKVCAFLEQFGAYPKKYAREIYNNESIVMGERKANRLINSCSLCGLCEAVCPEDFPMQDLCLEARRSMIRRGKMPPSAHEFALLDMAFSQSDRFALARHEPGCDQSRYLFFPGCQLCASSPGHVEDVYAFLRAALSGGVGLMLGCCSAPAFWAGREDDVAESMRAWGGSWVRMGRPEVVLACSTCFRMLKDHLPEVPARSLWEVIEETGRSANLAGSHGRSLALHDPCTTRHEPMIREAVRRLLAKMDVEAVELPLGGEYTECCGFGGLMANANPALAREVAARRAGISSSDYVTYCAMCRDNLAAAGKRVLHMLDLVFGPGKNGDPAQRPRPGWTERQENRERLKHRLLSLLWNEEAPDMDEHRTVRLLISPEARQKLEKRRILEEDLQRVIYHAESAGDRWIHPETGRLRAAFRPFRVTFWVEYESTEDGFVVHNAYCHRMQVVGAAP